MRLRIDFRRERSVSGSLRLIPGHRTIGYVDQVAPRQRHLRRQARTLVTDRVFGDLDQHGVARLQRVFDAPRLAIEAGGVPVDFSRVEDGVAAATNVDECGFHARQYVLYLAEVDGAHHGGRRLLRDVVLDEHVVFKHADLRELVALPDNHDAIDGLTSRQELGLGEHGWTAAALFASFATPLLLCLKPRGSLDRS